MCIIDFALGTQSSSGIRRYFFFLENEKKKNIDSKDDLKKQQFIKKPAQSQSVSVNYVWKRECDEEAF
jgi:hypothetical protein